MSTDVTIVIPHRGNPLGLWATIHSCEEDFRSTRSEISYNYVVVSNGEPLETEAKATIAYLQSGGKLLKHIHSEAPLTPPAARSLGASVSDSPLLFFFDNHCLVGRGYFERAVHDFATVPDMGILHSTTCFYSSDGMHYHYKLKLEYNFWAESSMIADDTVRPYRIAAGGHGGFAVRKSVWDDIGGYGPDDLFTGYGGEEMIFDLKAWLYGHKNYLDSKLIHYHYTGNRGYDRLYTDDYYTNLLVSALVVGGEKWLYKLYESFISRAHLRMKPKKNWFEILREAEAKGRTYADEVAKRSHLTFDELLVWFRTNLVAM